MKKNKDVQIYIAAHKKFDEPKNDIYVPLHVGSKGKDDLGYTLDSTGDNISVKNPNYCELTGLYWIWKNSKAKIVGLVHYRRYFYKSVFTNKNKLLDENQINKLLSKYDVIVAPKGYTWGTTVIDSYYDKHIKSDIDECGKIIKKYYSDYYESYNRIMNGNNYSPFNMIITKKEIFNEYCEWLFGVFDKLEKKIDVNDGRDNYNKRVYGFISERLLNVWLLKNNQYKTKELFVMNKEENIFRQKLEYILKKLIPFK